ncbi:serine hydroxymethyltransferase, partial [Patescibacteria group bacterium]|nr:serine hydroxymethyltransferase [Patescibacteria group bacterium]
DKIESLVQERAKTLFGVPHANVQPYSGSPANLVILSALVEPGQPIMGLNLLDGGHLTHGWKFSMTSKFWQSIPYHMTKEGAIDLEEVRNLALENKPKIIICGGTAIPRAIPFKAFADIAEEIGAYLLADVSHIAGLIVGGEHESPVQYADLIMTTTHKTLRGPRGAMIMVTQKGLEKDADLPTKIDKALIPGLQGGPHLNTIAGIGVALNEDSKPEFKEYAKQVVLNAKAMATRLTERGFNLVSGGTDNHLLLLDLTSGGVGRGAFFHEGLERLGIYTNKNTIPGDPSSPFYPSGLRIGTPAITTRGMKEPEMIKIADWIADFGEHIKDVKLPEDKETRKQVIKDFRASLKSDSFYDEMRTEVKAMCVKFAVPGV